MAQTINHEGFSCHFTAPGGGVVSGAGVLVGTTFVVAMDTVAAGSSFIGLTQGAVTLPKAAPLVIGDGVTVYWDNTAKNVTTTSSGNTKIGFAYGGGAASADTTVKVRLCSLAA